LTYPLIIRRLLGSIGIGRLRIPRELENESCEVNEAPLSVLGNVWLWIVGSWKPLPPNEEVIADGCRDDVLIAVGFLRIATGTNFLVVDGVCGLGGSCKMDPDGDSLASVTDSSSSGSSLMAFG
jgi:hypothetical protein